MPFPSVIFLRFNSKLNSPSCIHIQKLRRGTTASSLADHHTACSCELTRSLDSLGEELISPAYEMRDVRKIGVTAIMLSPGKLAF